MAPLAEKDEIVVSARVWHRQPPKARPGKAKQYPTQAGAMTPARQPAVKYAAQAGTLPVKAHWVAMEPLAKRPKAAPPVASPSSGSAASPSLEHVPVPERVGSPGARVPGCPGASRLSRKGVLVVPVAA
jgi:hypothetical protein